MARASGVIMATWEIPKQTGHLNAIIHHWFVVWNIFYLSIQLGMSSSQLNFIFFRGVGIPPTIHHNECIIG